jgi:ATP-dependent helicase/nuclease subunit B
VKLTVHPFGVDAMDALARRVAEAKVADPLAPVTIVVRDDIAAITVRRRLARGVGARPGVAAIDVTTLRRFADLLLARAGVVRPPVSPARLATLLRAELAADAGCLAAVAGHPATIRALVRAHRELREADEPALAIVADSGELGRDLVRLHRAVTARALTEHVDEVEVLDLATEQITAGADASKLGAIVLHLPAQLSPPELRLVGALQGGKSLDVLVGSTGVLEVDAPVVAQFGGGAVASRAPVASRIVHASDADDEVRAAVREVTRLLAAGTPAHRIGVLYATSTPYARLLRDHLGAAGVVVNGPGVRPLRDRAVADAFLALLQLDPDDLDRVAVFDWLGRAPVRLADGSSVPRTLWERLSREAGISGGDWTDQIDAHLDQQRSRLDVAQANPESTDAQHAYLERGVVDAGGLRAFVVELVATLRDGRSRRGWASLGEWALELFRRYSGSSTRLPEPEQRAATAIETTLGSLAELDGLGPEPGLADIVEILDVDLDARRPREGRFGDGVFVGPVAAAASLELDELLLLGLAEDLIPGRPAADPLLPDAVRVRTGGSLPTARDRLDQWHRDLLAALAAAPRVTASFPRGDLRRGSARLPSRWLMPSLRALTGHADLEATRWYEVSSPQVVSIDSHWRGVTGNEHPATEQEWRLRHHAGGGTFDDPVIDAAETLTEARRGDEFSRFDGNLSGAEGLPDFADGATLVSPTQLERYAGCPHTYFIERLLGVTSIDAPEEIVSIRPSDIGNIMHEVMERLAIDSADALPGFGEPWTGAQRQRMRGFADATMAEYERRGLTGHPRLWERERATILANLEALLDADDEVRAERDARVVASELRFGMAGIDPVHVEVDGGEVAMRGSADRVDERRDGTLIVTDFKSGSARTFVDIERGDQVSAGQKLQLPLYAHAARARFGASAVEAEYWFVGTKDRGKRVRVELDAALEDRYRFALGALVRGIRDGMFIPRPPAGDDFAWVQCAYCNPDGVGYGHVRADSTRKSADAVLADLFGLLDPTVHATEEGAR